MPETSSSDSTLGGALGDWLMRFAFLAVLAFTLGAVYVVVSPDGGSRQAPALVDLATSTTDAALPKAPIDSRPFETTDGEVVRPLRSLAVYAAPGSRPFAKVTPSTRIGDTWLPVIGQRPGWTQVLLPSRPNGSTGWVRTAQVERRTTPYLVRVHLGSRRLELYADGALVGSWPVAVGAPETPTPSGRTFLLGSITDDAQSFSPVILPLGAHSDSLKSYGGGPGTVAIHGWPDDSVFGTAVSHGCVRVPDDALDQLSQVPLGTLVVIDEQ